MRPYMIWPPTSSYIIFPVILALSPVLFPHKLHWLHVDPGTCQTHCYLTAFALIWNTLPQDICMISSLVILTPLLKYHLIIEGYCLGQDFPKTEPEIKISMHVVWGTTDPKGRTRGGRRESLTDHEE